MDDGRFKTAATRAKTNCRQYRHKISKANLFEFVESNVKAFNMKANANDNDKGMISRLDHDFTNLDRRPFPCRRPQFLSLGIPRTQQ